MKKIYVAHSNNIDFENEIYTPFRRLKNFELILPHEGGKYDLSRDVIKECDLFVADISEHKMGTGIEIGWANAYNVPIIFIYKKGSKVSSYMSKISENIFEYENLASEINKLKELIENIHEIRS